MVCPRRANLARVLRVSLPDNSASREIVGQSRCESQEAESNLWCTWVARWSEIARFLVRICISHYFFFFKDFFSKIFLQVLVTCLLELELSHLTVGFSYIFQYIMNLRVPPKGPKLRQFRVNLSSYLNAFMNLFRVCRIGNVWQSFFAWCPWLASSCFWLSLLLAMIHY